MLYYASGQTNFGYTQVGQAIPYVEFDANFGALTVGTWYHAVYTISGTSQMAYLNGVLKSTDSRLTATYTLTDPTMSLGFHAAFGDAFNGEIDDLRIYNTALTSIQVSSIWAQQGVPGRGVQTSYYSNISAPTLYSFSSQIFSNAQATSNIGPTQTQLNTVYPALAPTYLTSNTGIQTWTVPVTGTYSIVAAGAVGGTGSSGGGTAGRGVIVGCQAIFQKNQVISIIVGQSGVSAALQTTSNIGGGGGGGSFIVDYSTGYLYIAAGGGGGASAQGISPSGFDASFGQDGVNGTSSGTSGTNVSPGGTGGNGGASFPGGGSNGNAGGGGGGFYTNGGQVFSGQPGQGGFAVLNGAQGGLSSNVLNFTNSFGGFGGGGGSGGNFQVIINNGAGGGGGGGYSGGGAGSRAGLGAGGGGSYVPLGQTMNQIGYCTSNGYVSISYLYPIATRLTGTPLFTQLSPSATSSAVGAFSLRAVNGLSPSGTARAVNVKKITITDSSSSPVLPTLSSSITSNVLGPFSTNGSLFYNATGSPWPTPSKMQFDLFTSGNVFMECFVYFSTAPTSNFPALFYRSGQISVYFNNNSTLTLAIYNSTGGNAISPLTIGSIPLNTWRHVSVSINQQTSTAYASVNGSVVSASYTLGGSNYNSSNPFYLLINNPVPVNISNFRCVSGAATLPYTTTFTPPSSILTAYSSGTTIELLDGVASSTDFYADRLGNLLTTPVTGQSLASWLGGATGYVTTWYDQSGRGNHATQATAANQPKIDLVNKQIDFKPSAYFDLPNGTVPFGNSNYTMIVKHNTINATRAGFIGSGTYGTQNATNSLERNSIYINYWWSNDMSGGTYAQGSIISATYDNTIGRTLYVNGASVATNANKNRNSTNIQNTIGTDLRGNQGQSGGNRYLNGELYYVFLFGSALSDTDRTLVESLPI
jgi:hypothetical protein